MKTITIRVRLLQLLVLSTLFLFFPISLFAQFSPGKLAKAHSDLEGLKNCTKCHELGEGVIDSKCLECHTPLKQRIDQRQGYHSSVEVAGKSCSTCHSDHHGLDHELISWDQERENFNHNLTGYELTGKHAEQKCDDCHKPVFIHSTELILHETTNKETTHLGLEQNCITCHEDEHLDQLQDDCLNCHVMDGWTPAPGFHHDRSNYPLTGMHKEISCDKCHPRRTAPDPQFRGAIVYNADAGRNLYTQYNGLDYNNCIPCHRDVHENKFGQDCKSCHSTAGFERIKGEQFDHEDTEYPLRGRHIDVKCESCHTSGSMIDELAFEKCTDCHEDTHRAQFVSREDGGLCESCHTVDGFIPAQYGHLEHSKSEFPLDGSHLAIPCNLCHKQRNAEDGTWYTNFVFNSTSCISCHRDVHGGQLNIWIEKEGCTFCHSTESWSETEFDHNLARLPLEGRHRDILCTECHYVQEQNGERLVWMKPLEVTCDGCHEDIHQSQFLYEGELKTDCNRCHRPLGWTNLEFNHNTDSRFALTGAHEKVECSECHKEELGIEGVTFTLYKPLSTECVSCHGGNIEELRKLENSERR